MDKEFNVYGKIVINVELDVKATSEEDAIKKLLKISKMLIILKYTDTIIK